MLNMLFCMVDIHTGLHVYVYIDECGCCEYFNHVGTLLLRELYSVSLSTYEELTHTPDMGMT